VRANLASIYRWSRAFCRIRAIFAPVSRNDPKPGRWILPLVVAGLIAFTYVFVQALPQAEVPTVTTTLAARATTTTSAEPTTSTTTTTVSPVANAFLETTDDIDRNAADLSVLAQQINDDWDARTREYGETREALEDLETQTDTLVESLEPIDVPNSATDEWEKVNAGFVAMQGAAADMIDGLVNSSGSEDRLSALEDYKNAVAAVGNALDDVRDAIRDPAA